MMASNFSELFNGCCFSPARTGDMAYIPAYPLINQPGPASSSPSLRQHRKPSPARRAARRDLMLPDEQPMSGSLQRNRQQKGPVICSCRVVHAISGRCT